MDLINEAKQIIGDIECDDCVELEENLNEALECIP